MRAAVVETLGNPPRYASFDDPKLAENEVLVHVKAAGLHQLVKAIAAGKHYSFSGQIPLVPGVDGVGVLEDGRRVYFGRVRAPWGTMAELAAVPQSAILPLPDVLDDVSAAAIANPGMSAWLSIHERAQLAAGETILILGATGVAGQLAIQIARYLGAKRIIGAGRNVEALKASGVDEVISLTDSEDALKEAFVAQAKQGIDVVIDYLWGRPAELLMESLATGFAHDKTSSTRWVEVGESAGRSINLPGAVLRSIDLKLLGSGFGSVPLHRILSGISEVFSIAATGKITVEADAVPIAEVESSWGRSDKGRRVVFTL